MDAQQERAKGAAGPSSLAVALMELTLVLHKEVYEVGSCNGTFRDPRAKRGMFARFENNTAAQN